jgi:hypothetical protein
MEGIFARGRLKLELQVESSMLWEEVAPTAQFKRMRLNRAIRKLPADVRHEHAALGSKLSDRIARSTESHSLGETGQS